MIEGERHFGPVWFIPGDNKGKYPYCHSIYIDGAGILIDPASNRQRLLQLKEEKMVKEIWLSHWHEDHFMHLDLFEDLPLRISGPDAGPLKGVDALIEAYGFEDELQDEWRKILLETFNFKPRKPSAFLNDGDVISLGPVTVEVIHTPGHTPGHLAFFFREQSLLFMGDYDLTSFGPWYGDVFSDIPDTIKSLNHLKAVHAKIWVGAHETGVFEKNPGDLWEKYLEVIEVRERKLLELLKSPRTIEDIIRACIVYRKPREPKMFFEFGERAIMKKHLELLMKMGVVGFGDDKYYLKQSI